MVKYAPFSALPGIIRRWRPSFLFHGTVLKHLKVIGDNWDISRLLTLQPALPQGHLYLQPELCSAASASAINRWVQVHQQAVSSICIRQFTSTIPTKKSATSEDALEAVPDHSVLQPPKQAPSVWQIFFTDWLGNKRASDGEDAKLNVVKEAKAAAKAYGQLSDEEHNELKARAKILKEQYDADLETWRKSLTPVDVERENVFRAAQRKSGKSRRKNIVDPNAPKKPMSAYFWFLRGIRANPQMTREVFGSETEPPRQSVLAAAKWRSMSDEEKQPYLAQAVKAKLEYELQRREYEIRMQASPLTSLYILSGSMEKS